MSAAIFENREAYLQNTYFQHHKREHGDFTPFYITVTICTLLFAFIIILNIVLGCCSRYSTYWADRHTGNRWIASLWTATPHKQPSLDYSELKSVYVDHPIPEYVDHPVPGYKDHPVPAYEPPPPQPPPEYYFPSAPAEQSKSSEVLELQQQKRESAI